MSNGDKVCDLLIVIVKKLNFIEILETICLLLKTGETNSLPKEEILNNIETFLNSKDLETNNKEHFLALVASLLAFYNFDEAFSQNLAKMFFDINTLKMECQNIFSEFINILASRKETIYCLVYRSIIRDLNTGKSLFEIMLYFKNNYQDILEEFQNSSSVISFDFVHLDRELAKLKKDGEDNPPGIRGK